MWMAEQCFSSVQSGISSPPNQMKRKSNPKNLHWVSYFYLRYFATPESRLNKQPQAWIFSKDDTDGDEVLTNIRNICGKRYLYAPTDASGKRDYLLEQKLEKLESAIGILWPKVADGFIDLGEATVRKGLSLFIAVMHLRNPEFRKSLEKTHTQFVEAFSRLPSKDGKPNVDRIKIEGQTYPFDAKGWDEYRDLTKNDHDRSFAQFIQSEAIRMAETLMKKRWSIVLSEQDSFITTDRPVLLGHESRRNYGYGTPGVLLTFPLSPKRILVMDDMHDEHANLCYPLAPQDVGAYNLAAWHNGSRFLITGRAVPEVLLEMNAWANAQVA
jgi:uncharacterized protein DUF4238